MPTTTPITIRILGDASKAKQTLAQIDGELGGFGNKVGGHMGKIAGLIGGAFAGFQVVNFVKAGVDSLTNMDRIVQQTAAVVKSTGAAAQVSADQVATLADSIERTTGIESESVRAGENMLLTFTNIKNGVGQGNDVFDQATKTLVDMSTAMGSDPQQAAIQLGKALNDPVKGVTALTKVGVTFDDQQKKHIETLVKSGKTMEAQKVILAELNKEFGGSADAFGKSDAGKIARFKNAIGDLQEKLANGITPVLTKLASLIADKMPGAIDKISRAWDNFMGGVESPAATIDASVSTFDRVFLSLGAAVGKALPTIEKIINFIKDNWKPVLAAAAVVLTATLIPSVVALGAAMLAVEWPIVLIVGAIAALVAGFVYAYTHFEGFRNVVDKVVSFVKDKMGDFVAWVKEVWPQVQEAIGHIVNLIKQHLEDIKRFWDEWGPTITSAVKGIWEAISSVVGAAINIIKNVIQFVLAIINGDWGKAWDALKGIVTSAWDGIKGLVNGAVNAIVAVIKGVGSKIKTAASGMWDGLKDAFKSALNWIIDKWNNFKIPAIKVAGQQVTPEINFPDIPKFAEGGIARRGLAIVGDAGPELVNFGSTSRVFNNDELQSFTSQPQQIVKNYNIDMSGVLSPEITPETIVAAIEYAELRYA